ncbi:MAG TPA: cation/multidrug efflux pump [Chromatiales bacterium]|nr:cation/multidrug efflux pump [Chromatiales bacterium]
MGLTWITLGFGLVGSGLFVLGLRRIWRWKMVSGSLQGLGGVALISVALLLGAIATNLHTYQRLTHESPVATLRFERLAPQQFRVILTRAGQNAEVYTLRGDEWQLDGRVLKWHGVANLLGLDSDFRLERLSGRYHDAERDAHARRSVHALSRSEGLDIWALARDHPGWVPWVDAVYGSATYMPMTHGARYAVRMTQSGLVARPLNAPAREAVAHW